MGELFPAGKLFCHFSLTQFCALPCCLFSSGKAVSLRGKDWCVEPGVLTPGTGLGWSLGGKEVGGASELTWWPPGGHFRQSPGNSRALRLEKGLDQLHKAGLPLHMKTQIRGSV